MFSGTQSEYQTIWIQIRTGVICKGYQQPPNLLLAGKDVKCNLDHPSYFCLLFAPDYKLFQFYCKWRTYLWPVTRKGTSWVSYSEIHFFRVLNREFYDESRNINMLVGSWSFWVSKCPKKMGTALKRHKLSIDVIVTLHIHIKSSRLTHVIKYCKRTLHCICCNFFLLSSSIYYSSHSSSSISSSNAAPDIFSSLQLHYSVNT